MDTNTDRIINLLIAVSGDGDLAADFRDELTEQTNRLLAVEELADAANGVTDSFMAAMFASILFQIFEEEDQLNAIAGAISTTYLVALLLGLSIATLAAEA